jgi:hypothetical protein
MGKTRERSDRWGQLGRIALRREGKNWNAYYAKPDTMDGAIWLASIRMDLVEGDRRVKADFMDLVRTVVDGIVRESLGTGEIEWERRPAPEHEKAGHG